MRRCGPSVTQAPARDVAGGPTAVVIQGPDRAYPARSPALVGMDGASGALPKRRDWSDTIAGPRLRDRSERVRNDLAMEIGLGISQHPKVPTTGLLQGRLPGPRHHPEAEQPVVDRQVQGHPGLGPRHDRVSVLPGVGSYSRSGSTRTPPPCTARSSLSAPGAREQPRDPLIGSTGTPERHD